MSATVRWFLLGTLGLLCWFGAAQDAHRRQMHALAAVYPRQSVAAADVTLRAIAQERAELDHAVLMMWAAPLALLVLAGIAQLLERANLRPRP